MRAFSSLVVAAGFGIVATGVPATAQDFSYGQSLFKQNCAVCHGETGVGDGPVAGMFQQQPRNLRHLASDNNGVFPFSETYQAIDGRRDVGGHGTTEMPVWGALFMEEALPKEFHPGVSAKEIVQGRILGLVYYLQSIQE